MHTHSLPSIQIRPAQINDAPLIAQAVCMAIGEETCLKYCGADYLNIVTEIARSPHTQYSYLNALVAEKDVIAIGAAVGYDGARLHELRHPTLDCIQQRSGIKPNIEEETQAGEYYIDTVAVLPEHRGTGIGTFLLKSIIQRAFNEGHATIGLLVDQANPRAEQLYTSLGFCRQGEKQFFGHRMWHMQYSKLSESESLK